MTDPAALTPANEPDSTPVYEHWGHGPGGTAPHSAALTDEELAEMDTAFRRSGRYPDLRAYGLRLIAALRAEGEELWACQHIADASRERADRMAGLATEWMEKCGNAALEVDRLRDENGDLRAEVERLTEATTPGT